MFTNFINDLDVVDPSTVEIYGPTYPIAQWLNGDPKLALSGGVAYTGGVILPLKYLKEDVAPAPGWMEETIAFSTGKSEPVLAAPTPKLAVIRTRFRWFVSSDGLTTYYPRANYVQETGMRGHLQALCGIEGYEFPVVVTFKGKASQEFERLLKVFNQTIQEAYQRSIQSHKHFPRFAFYLTLQPGPHVKVGQKGQESMITPPALELPNTLTRDDLSQMYVGRERLVYFQQLYHDATEWAAAWDRPGTETILAEEPEA